jgi:uncharacterized protein
MSTTDDDGEEIPGREIAYRLFAAEYDDATLSYAESDEERAPNYVITPTGARLNRVFAVGTLTEITPVNDEMVRARIVDPTGAFVVYAGQYQPDELAVLESLEAPAFVAVTGKARTFQPDDSDRVYTSIRPESIAVVDADTRDRWVVSAAEQTLDRIGTYAAAAELGADGDELAAALREDGVESGLADGIPLALGHYDTTPSYLAALRECAVEAVEVVADEREQVSGLSFSPGETSPAFEATFGSLAATGDTALEMATETTTDLDPESEPDPAAATAGEGEPEPMSTATADEFSAGEDVPTDATDPEPDTAAEMDEFDADDEPETTAFDETAETETESDADDELGDFESDAGGMYEMDDDEREQLESEFGTEFATGGEVDDPGEADIDVPEPEDVDETVADPEPSADDLGEAPTSTLGDEPAAGSSSSDTESESEPPSDDEPADDIDLQSAVIETMSELDDGDGADRSALVDRIADDTGADEDAIEAAIEEALMGGECYEPDDETLKAI